MKKGSALSLLTPMQERFHEADKTSFPERHWLMKDSYGRPEMDEMCTYCAEHYEWDKELDYNVRLDRYFKKRK